MEKEKQTLAKKLGLVIGFFTISGLLLVTAFFGLYGTLTILRWFI